MYKRQVIEIIQCYVVFTANKNVIAKIKELRKEGKDIDKIHEALSTEGYKKRDVINAIATLSNGKVLSVGNLFFP